MLTIQEKRIHRNRLELQQCLRLRLGLGLLRRRLRYGRTRRSLFYRARLGRLL